MNKIFLGLMSLALITACSAPAVKDTLLIQQSAQEQAKNLGLSAQDVLAETRDLQVLAQREDLYFYSPTYIAQAEEEIRSAESAFKDKLDIQTIITHALTGQKLLKRGLENKKTALSQLTLSLDGLALLEKLKAPTLFPSDYSDVQSDIRDLIILIEQGNATQAIKDQGSVLNDITEIEINVLKKTYLGQAEKALEKAIDADAEDFAPVSIEKANSAVEKLTLFIEQNRKQLEDIDIETQKAIHLAQHAEHVAVTVEPLLKLKIKEAEQHVLFIEKLIARIGKALNQQDVTHLPLDNQSIALAQAAETISKQAMAVKQQDQWGNKNSELKAKLSKLQKELDKALKIAQQKTIAPTPAVQDDTAPSPVKSEKAAHLTTVPTTITPITDNTTTAADKNSPAKPALIPLPIQDKPVAQVSPAPTEANNAEPLDTAKVETPEPVETIKVETAPVEVAQKIEAEDAIENKVTETSDAPPTTQSNTNNTGTVVAP
jgi:hypothetical protein